MATYNLDPKHTAANFVARHMMITTVRGGFRNVAGTVEFDAANPAAGSVEVTIDAASLYSGVEDRDNHLRSADFLDVENYPNITFRSTGINVTGKNTAKITGNLAIRGVTRSVVLDTEFLGEETNPWGAKVIGFTATTKINREDWGLTWNVGLETGGVLVSKEIKLEIEAQGVLVTEPVPAQQA